MKKIPLICPVCHKQLDLLAGEYQCVQVKQGSCHVLDVRSLRGDTEETVYFLHPEHFDEFSLMVRSRVYSTCRN
jgi:hypothetical protein